MTARSVLEKCLIALVVGALASRAGESQAARPRRPSAAQIKKMKEELEYRQKEMVRVQQEVAAKEREFYLSFDENGNGHLEGAEKAKYDKQLHAIQTGKAANPLATILPPGQGPRDSTAAKNKPAETKK